MIKISIRENESSNINPKQELMKQVNWGVPQSSMVGQKDPSAIEFNNLLDIMELRQKVLIKYQATDYYEKKIYENILKRLQNRVLSHFEKAIDIWIKTHQYQTGDLEQKIQELESLKSQFKSTADSRGDSDIPSMARIVSRVLLQEQVNKENFEDAVKTQRQMHEAYMTPVDYGKLLQAVINEMTSLKLVASSNMKIKEYIEKAKRSGDIDQQIVAFEQALSAVHNSGPLLQYLLVDEYDRPVVEASEPFEAFLTYLSNMKDEDLNLTEADTDKIQQVASVNYKSVIAFLGKNQMKEWATPKSDWELVLNGLKGKQEWEPIAKEMGIVDNNEIPTPNGYAYMNDDENLIVRNTGAQWRLEASRDVYYSKDKNFSFSPGIHMTPEQLEKVFNILNDMDLPPKHRTDIKISAT
jgi:hypothetical protein